jgi:hypothetical protein
MYDMKAVGNNPFPQRRLNIARKCQFPKHNVPDIYHSDCLLVYHMLIRNETSVLNEVIKTKFPRNSFLICQICQFQRSGASRPVKNERLSRNAWW